MVIAETSAAAPRRISVFGATGSIGVSTLDLIARNRDRFDVVALTAHSSAAQLAEQALEFRPEVAVIADDGAYLELKSALAGSGIEVAAGKAGLVEAARRPADWVMASIVGAAGLEPALAALQQGTILGLANKECLVSAGDFFMSEVARTGATLIPVDSEHSAIFQVFDPDRIANVARIVLTASGGPFRDWSLDRLAAATRAEALQHPNWEMGAKITIDSATMMNKGLELIEAHYLFPVGEERIDILVHPQSIIHSVVEYDDGSVLAQMGMPDMRTPIAYALAWPERMKTPVERLDLAEIGQLTFESPDSERFPALAIAREALKTGRGAPTVMNAANEVAVAAFLADRIGYLDIARFVEQTIDQADRTGELCRPGSLEDVLSLDAAGRELCSALISGRPESRQRRAPAAL
ncbi:MAG: 1-deoxy-D-xylulose-5-phosphate reductoisomerase [Hyphomicrobiales bacterium]|nr:MAG: 1-deoxy-D-xylulose-5-phosphate reductoisomerase [Hyphomicrobiales bacterium]